MHTKRKYSPLLFCLAVIASLIGSLLSALRPTVISSLISGELWLANLGYLQNEYFSGLATIYILLILEIFEFSSFVLQGTCLSKVAVTIGEDIRAQLTEKAIVAMASNSEEYLNRYIGLCKSYVDVIEIYFRQNLVPTISAGIQLSIAIIVTLSLNPFISELLVSEILLLLLMTGFYGGIHHNLSSGLMKADEKLINNGAMNPRKGISIWFGGISKLWFGSRIDEIQGVSRTKFKVWFGETIFYNLTTAIAGLFIVLGYFVLIVLEKGSKQDFITLLLYAGFMLGPIVRIASIVPEYREYSFSRKEIFNAMAKVLYKQMNCDGDTTSSSNNISVEISENTTAIDSRVVSIHNGDRVTLIGKSGSGKTSILLGLLGVNNEKINEINFKNNEISNPDLKTIYLSDTPVFEYGTVLKNMDVEESICMKLIDEWDIFPGNSESKNREYLYKNILASGEPMSLGERQRLQLLRTLIKNPKVLFLDEALSGIEEELELSIVNRLIADSSIDILVYVGHRISLQNLFYKKIYI